MQVDQQMKQAQMVGDQQLQQLRIENERMLQEMRIQNEAEISRMKQEYESVRTKQELVAKQAIEAQKAKMEADAKIMVARIGIAGADVPDIEAQASQASMIADQIAVQMEGLLRRIQNVESTAIDRHTETLNKLQDALAAMTAPKRIVRDQDGRAVGVEMVKVGEM
jgi:hypothetical protein